MCTLVNVFISGVLYTMQALQVLIFLLVVEQCANIQSKFIHMVDINGILCEINYREADERTKIMYYAIHNGKTVFPSLLPHLIRNLTSFVCCFFLFRPDIEYNCSANNRKWICCNFVCIARVRW